MQIDRLAVTAGLDQVSLLVCGRELVDSRLEIPQLPILIRAERPVRVRIQPTPESPFGDL
ncbi:hypothetical protein [Antrihabitans stalagmiti]|uniref:hypothetical protein n=1 Tax=Antrihabitans stalagmiti TaxID=2799499 RepID=UPI001F31C46B|nr:hypothetical protein [Antrihabitans stalagmiti]